MDYFCQVCRETSTPDVEHEWCNGVYTEFVHCAECGSDRVMRVDDMFDAAEYSKGER